jgi:putative ABC transport system ATP-binding protein
MKKFRHPRENEKKCCAIRLEGVNKYYNRGLPSEVHVLKDVNISINYGDFISIMGPSGSGKTTMLDILGCLMRPSTGKVFIDNQDVSEMDDSDLARVRGEKLGFIFQQYNLIPNLTATENVELAMRINGKPRDFAKSRAIELLKEVGLGHRLNNRPNELSGGEQQRVAIARALSNEPRIILGDEPTGNLDTKSGSVVLDLLTKLHRKGYTIVMVTHDPNTSRITERTIRLKDGEIAR